MLRLMLTLVFGDKVVVQPVAGCGLQVHFGLERG